MRSRHRNRTFAMRCALSDCTTAVARSCWCRSIRASVPDIAPAVTSQARAVTSQLTRSRHRVTVVTSQHDT
eukprot:3702301-Rhodomonas_salina.1